MKTKYYKHVLVSVLCMTLIKGITAQEEKRCGTAEAMKELYRAHPEMLQERIEYEKIIQQQIKDNQAQSNSRSTETVYIIPVVFHVIHTNGSENISDAQIFDEMANLNKAFRKLNADTSLITTLKFKKLASDIKIEFRLAQLDPNGNCTNGIDRIYSHLTSKANDKSKLNPWPGNKYLNIWTVKSIERTNVAGYAYFPSNDIYQIPYEGVIILHNHIGSIGTGAFSRSKTLTHEIGHFLNLQHPWGDGEVAIVCGDDGVNDTPLTRGHTTCSNYDLFTPICNVTNTSKPYTFAKVTTVSGTIDTTATPIEATSGATFGRFTATGVSSNSTVNGSFSFSDWDTGASNGDTAFTSLSGSINTSKYYEVKITPDSGASLTLTGILFNFQRSATGVRSYAVRSSIDGFANNLPGQTGGNKLLEIKNTNEFFCKKDTTSVLFGSTIILNGASYTNIINASPVTFRFYGWNAEDAAGTFSIDNATFTGTVGEVENIQNYMDYSSCPEVMFTKGQKERMRAALESPIGQRDRLFRSSNLAATGVDGSGPTCAPYPDFYANRYNICSGDNVTFTKNIKKGTIASNPQWSFPGGTPSSSTDINPVIKYDTPGVYTVKLTAVNSAGSDSVIKTNIIHVDGNADFNGLFSENFEVINNFWNWQVYDLDNNTPKTWILSTQTGYNSGKSLVMNAYGNYELDVDELISPSFNLSNVSNPVLTFRSAGASKAMASADLNDYLRIYSSNTCGATWSLRSTIQGAALANNGFHSENFIPTSSSQWALQTIPIPVGVATSNVRFKFEYTTGKASNNIYIDDINISGVVGINENSLGVSSISIYPNPTNNTSIVYYHLNEKANVRITVVDMLGKTISEINNGNESEGDHSVVISKQELHLNNGIYFIKFWAGDNSITQKLIVTE